MTRHEIASVASARRGRRTWHVKTLLAREPEIPGPASKDEAPGQCREGEEP